MSRVSPEWASATVTSHSWPQHQLVHITWHLTLSSFFNHRSQELEVSLFVFCLSFLFCLAFFYTYGGETLMWNPTAAQFWLNSVTSVVATPLIFFQLFFFWVQLGRWFVGLRLWFLKRWGEPQFWTCLDNMSKLQSRFPDAPTHLQWAAHHCKSPDVKINEMREFEWGNRVYLVT